MKIIDLLNKIANGEELPKKIYCFNREFYLKENIYFEDTFTLMHYIQEEDLNDEVEIIEEKKKIPKKLEIYKITDETISGLRKSINILNEDIVSKINEIIDYLKEKENK